MKEPTLKLPIVLTILTMLAGSMVFIYTSNAETKAYADSRVETAKIDLEKIVDLKIETIKVDVKNIKESMSKVEQMQVNIYKVVTQKKE